MTKKYFDDCGGISKVEERPLLYCQFLQVRREGCVMAEGV